GGGALGVTGIPGGEAWLGWRPGARGGAPPARVAAPAPPRASSRPLVKLEPLPKTGTAEKPSAAPSSEPRAAAAAAAKPSAQPPAVTPLPRVGTPTLQSTPATPSVSAPTPRASAPSASAPPPAAVAPSAAPAHAAA